MRARVIGLTTIAFGAFVATACSLAYPLGGYSSSSSSASSASSSGGSDASSSSSSGSTGADGTAPVTGGTEPFLAYGTRSGAVRARRYLPAENKWSAPIEGPNAGRTVHWVVARRSNDAAHRTVGVLSANEAYAEVKLQVYDVDDGKTFVPAFESLDFFERPEERLFDIAYEARGRAIAVYGGHASGNPRMRIRETNGTWSEEMAVFQDPPNNVSPEWIKLVTRAGTDDMTLLYSDGEDKLHLARWQPDLGKFEGAARLEETVRTDDWRSFDGAYEPKSGNLLVTWSASNFEGVKVMVCPKGAFVCPTNYGSIPVRDKTATITLTPSPDPESNLIAYAGIEDACGHGDCDDYQTGIWNGSGWEANSIPDDDILTSYDNLQGASLVSAAWLDNTHVVSTYFGDSPGFRWSTWYLGGPDFKLEPDVVTTPPMGPKASFVPFRVTNGATPPSVVVLMNETTGRLWAKRFDGTSWTATEENQTPLETDIPDTNSRGGIPFGVDVP